MRLLLFLPWLCLLSNASRDTHLRIATARALKFKCESLLYRSHFDGNTCYFAIQEKVKHGDENCALTLAGAKMRVDRARERALGRLYLNPTTYHDGKAAGQMRNVLCSLDIPYTCEQGQLSLPGKCVIRSEKPVTWSEASNFCNGKGANNVVIHNEYENKVVAGALRKNEGGWILPSRGNIWPAEGQTIDYWKWAFKGRTPADLKCSVAVITKTGKAECSSHGKRKVDNLTKKNIAICVKEAECPLCPTVATPCVNGPPKQNDLWDLRYYYNWGKKLHAFCATPEGCKRLQDNGNKYCDKTGTGSLGGTLSDEGYKRLKEVCCNGEERKNIVKMWFTKKGSSYHHVFEDSTESKDVYVGYVSLKAGACGSKSSVKKWSCQVSGDVMYAQNLTGKIVQKAEWYMGREQDGGKEHFWLWKMETKCINGPPKQNDLWDLRYFYNWGKKLHAFCATREGCKNIHGNGIKYCDKTGTGSLGGTLSDEGYKRLKEICCNGEERKNIVKMWFSKKGSSYHHVFEDSTESKDVYVGYVSLKAGACGSKSSVKKWSCQVSGDVMYAGNLSGKIVQKAEWYKGREQDGGRNQFWLWETNEKKTN